MITELLDKETGTGRISWYGIYGIGKVVRATVTAVLQGCLDNRLNGIVERYLVIYY